MITNEQLDVLKKYNNPNLNELYLISNKTKLNIDVVTNYYIDKLSQEGGVDVGRETNYN